MFHRRPAALDQLSDNTSKSLARLAGLEGFSRSLLVGTIPIVALSALGSKENVAQLYLFAGILTLFVTLNIGTLESFLQRRWVVTLGAVFLFLAALFLYTEKSALLSLGIGMRSAAASIFSVCMSLYIMDYIGKRDLSRNESRRMQYTGLSWFIGPFLGTWLVSIGQTAIAFGLSALSSVLMLIYFWTLRLGSNQVLQKAQSSAKNPLLAIRRFTKQKYLRVAYGITLSRSCFWVAMFIYGPIYVLEAGYPAWAAGLLLSGISVMLFFSPLVKRLADQVGTRQIIVGALLLTGLSTAALGLVGEAKPIGLVFWVSGAVGGVMLDVLGNIPFMRMVKPRERTSMTTVFSTWREASELLTPTIVTVALLVYDFQLFFYILALMHIGSSFSATRLPKRL